MYTEHKWYRCRSGGRCRAQSWQQPWRQRVPLTFREQQQRLWKLWGLHRLQRASAASCTRGLPPTSPPAQPRCEQSTTTPVGSPTAASFMLACVHAPGLSGHCIGLARGLPLIRGAFSFCTIRYSHPRTIQSCKSIALKNGLMTELQARARGRGSRMCNMQT